MRRFKVSLYPKDILGFTEIELTFPEFVQYTVGQKFLGISVRTVSTNGLTLRKKKTNDRQSL